MTQPPESQPPARPFHPEAVETAPWRLDRRAVVGCGAGCLILFGLFVVLLVTVAMRGSSLLALALSMSQQALLTEAPEDWTEEDQRRLAAAFDVAAGALRDGGVSTADLEGLRGALLESLSSAGQGTLHRDQLEELRRRLEMIAGVAGSADRDRHPVPAPAVA